MTVFHNKSILIVGLAKSGIACIEKLLKQDVKNIYVYDDSQEIMQSYSKDGVLLYDDSVIDSAKIDYAIVSPGIPLYGPNQSKIVNILKARNIEIICDLDVLYLLNPKAKYIGITGTNGKSTTTALVGHILKECGHKVQVGGNIGVAASTLDDLDENGMYVLEISSFQLELTKYLRLDIACIINITPDHIDRHLSIENYLKAKAKIFQITKDCGSRIISIDYLLTQDISTNFDIVKFSTHHKTDIYLSSSMIIDSIANCSMQVQTKLKGLHNLENILASYAITSKACNDGMEKILHAVRSFNSLEHRMEEVLNINGLTFINDSKATNADATEKALECLEDIHLILGGVPKEGGISSIAELIGQKAIHVYLIGQAADLFEKQLHGYKECSKFSDMKEVLLHLKKQQNIKGIVLLSPACASYDQFQNFEHRGSTFKEIVHDLWGNEC